MAATTGWLVAPDASKITAIRYRYGAVPEGHSAREQIPTFFNESVAFAALPGIWAAVICVFTAWTTSLWWLAGLPVALAGIALGIAILARGRARATANRYAADHVFVDAQALQPAAARVAAAGVAAQPLSEDEKQVVKNYRQALRAMSPVAHSIELSQDALAVLRTRHEAGEITIKEFQTLAWEPSVRGHRARADLATFTGNCQQLAVAMWTRSRAARGSSDPIWLPPRTTADNAAESVGIVELLSR